MTANDFWSLPTTEARALLALKTDLELGRIYHMRRATLGALRKRLGVPVHRPWARRRAARSRAKSATLRPQIGMEETG